MLPRASIKVLERMVSLGMSFEYITQSITQEYPFTHITFIRNEKSESLCSVHLARKIVAEHFYLSKMSVPKSIASPFGRNDLGTPKVDPTVCNLLMTHKYK